MDFTHLSIDFSKLTARELMLVNLGRNAALMGGPHDRVAHPLWRAGWELGNAEAAVKGHRPQRRVRYNATLKALEVV